VLFFSYQCTVVFYSRTSVVVIYGILSLVIWFDKNFVLSEKEQFNEQRSNQRISSFSQQFEKMDASAHLQQLPTNNIYKS
jgi:hypothetical protein